MSEVEGSSWRPRPAEPYEPGNVVALKHGAYSPRFVHPLATEIVEAVRGSCSWWTDADGPAVWAWARAEAQAQLLTEWLARVALESGDGVGDLDADRVRSAYLLLHRAEARAATGRARLGLDPLSRARLGRDVAAARVDVARLMAAIDDDDGEGDGG